VILYLLINFLLYTKWEIIRGNPFFYGKWVLITEIINRPDCIYEAEDRSGYIYTIAEKDINHNRTEKQKGIYLSGFRKCKK